MEGYGRSWKVMEGHGKSWKVMEGNRRSWKPGRSWPSFINSEENICNILHLVFDLILNIIEYSSEVV